MRNSDIPPKDQIFQTTSNFNPPPSSQRGGYISSNPNVRGAISSSGSSYSTTTTYGGPGLPQSRVTMPSAAPTPMFSGSSALAPKGGLGQNPRGASMPLSSGYTHSSMSPKAESYIPVGCDQPKPISSNSPLQPSPGSVPSPYAPHPGSHPMNPSPQRGAPPSASLQPSPGSVPSPYAPHPGSHPMNANHQNRTVPSTPLQPAPGSVPSPYESAFKPYGGSGSSSEHGNFGNRFSNPTGGF